MSVRVVEQAEVVEVEEGHTDGSAVRSRRLDLRPERLHERAVVEGARQRIAARRLEQLERLAREALLGRAEDEEEQQRAHERRRERDGHDADATFLELREDRRGIAPHSDHGIDPAGVDDRQVLA